MILVFDTETTGLLAHPDAELFKQPRIIEFGAALLSVETGEVVDKMNILIHPQMKVPPDSIKIHGITDDDLKAAPIFSDVVEQISAFFARARTMFAHNLPFDSGMLRNELRSIGGDVEANFPWPQQGICTVGLYAPQFGYNPNQGLLYETVMGVPMSHSHTAHRALDDVMALVEIIQKEELWRF